MIEQGKKRHDPGRRKFLRRGISAVAALAMPKLRLSDHHPRGSEQIPPELQDWAQRNQVELTCDTDGFYTVGSEANPLTEDLVKSWSHAYSSYVESRIEPDIVYSWTGATVMALRICMQSVGDIYPTYQDFVKRHIEVANELITTANSDILGRISFGTLNPPHLRGIEGAGLIIVEDALMPPIPCDDYVALLGGVWQIAGHYSPIVVWPWDHETKIDWGWIHDLFHFAGLFMTDFYGLTYVDDPTAVSAFLADVPEWYRIYYTSRRNDTSPPDQDDWLFGDSLMGYMTPEYGRRLALEILILAFRVRDGDLHNYQEIIIDYVGFDLRKIPPIVQFQFNDQYAHKTIKVYRKAKKRDSTMEVQDLIRTIRQDARKTQPSAAESPEVRSALQILNDDTEYILVLEGRLDARGNIITTKEALFQNHTEIQGRDLPRHGIYPELDGVFFIRIEDETELIACRWMDVRELIAAGLLAGLDQPASIKMDVLNTEVGTVGGQMNWNCTFGTLPSFDNTVMLPLVLH